MICLYSWSSRTQPSINKTINCGWCVIGGGAGGEHQHQHGLHAQSDVGAVQVRNQDHKHSVLDKSCIVADLNLDECICGNIIIVKVQNLLSPPPESPDWLSTLLWSQVTVSTGSLLFEGSAPHVRKRRISLTPFRFSDWADYSANNHWDSRISESHFSDK